MRSTSALSFSMAMASLPNSTSPSARNARAAARGLGQAEQAVEIDLGGGQHAIERRRAAEAHAGVAAQFDGTVVRPVLEIDLVEHRSGAVALEAGAQPPGLDDERRRTGGRG